MGIRSALATALGVSAVATPIHAQSATSIEYRERTRPTGGVGTRISAGFLEDVEQNAEIRGEKWHGRPGVLGFAGKMDADPHVRKSADYILHPIAAAKWVFQPESSDPLDIEVARFATHVFFERLPWEQIVRRVGKSYFKHGFALEEMTDAIGAVSRDRFPNHPRPEAALLPSGFHHRPAWSVYRWHQSKTNPAHVESIQQYIPGSDGEQAGFPHISADRLVRWTWDQDGADFEGRAIYRSAYGAWKSKMILRKLYLQASEKHAVGQWVGETGPDPAIEDIDAFEESLADIRSRPDGYLVLPNGWKADPKSGSPGMDLLPGIEKCDTDIAINVGSGYMRLGLTGNSGSHALGSTQQGHHHLEVDGHARFIASALYHGSDGWSPVERIIRANYGHDVAIPRPVAVNLPTRNWREVAKTYGALKAQGAIRADGKTEDAIRESLGLPPHDPESAYALNSAPMSPKEALGEESEEGASDEEEEDRGNEPESEDEGKEVAA